MQKPVAGLLILVAGVCATAAWWMIRDGGSDSGPDDLGQAADQQVLPSADSGAIPPLPPPDPNRGPALVGNRTNPYPDNSQPLSSTDVRYLRPDRPDVRRTVIGEATKRGGHWLSIDMDRYFVVGDESLTVQVAVFDEAADGKVLPSRVVEGSLLSASGETIPMEFHDDGQRGDQSPEDHIHTATIVATEHPVFGEQPTPATIQVSVELEDGKTVGTGSRVVQYIPRSARPARFTGAFDDRLVGGHLEIAAGVMVKVPGPYVFEGNLFLGDQPVARASFRADLETGNRRMELTFYGKILADHGASGSYTLRNLRGSLIRAGQKPPRLLMSEYDSPYSTGSYEVAEFATEHWAAEK